MDLPEGISEGELKNFIETHGSEFMKENFIGVFAADEVSEYIDLAKNIKEKKCNQPFMFANTDTRENPGTHWWSIIAVEPKDELFFFDSFGKLGFSHFVIDNDKELIKQFVRVYLPYKKNNSTKKINFIKIKFNVNKYHKLNKKLKKQLTETTERLFNFFCVFAARNNTNFLKITILDTQLQNVNNSYCGIFCLSLIYNLFYPRSNSVIVSDDQCTVRTISNIINETFFGGETTDIQDQNLPYLRDFVSYFNIKGDFENGKDQTSD